MSCKRISSRQYGRHKSKLAAFDKAFSFFVATFLRILQGHWEPRHVVYAGDLNNDLAKTSVFYKFRVVYVAFRLCPQGHWGERVAGWISGVGLMNFVVDVAATTLLCDHCCGRL